MRLAWSVVSSVAGAIACAVVAYFVPGYWQTLLLNLCTTLLGLAVGLVIINHLLNQGEKRKAAVPLLRMIAPSITDMHNEHFIGPGRLQFGTPDWNRLIDVYQKNRRKPEALSPEQRNGLYSIIKEHRDQAIPLLESIYDQLKELVSILGWSFSPRIVAASMDARLDILKFKKLTLDDTEQAKLKACELYLDIDGSCGAVLHRVTEIIGLDESDWQGESGD